MATKKAKEKITSDYFVQMLDNGITLSQNEWIECEKYGGEGENKNEDLYKFLGKVLWGEILNASECLRNSQLKVTISIQE